MPYFFLILCLNRRNHSVINVREIEKLRKLRLRLLTYEPRPRISLPMRTANVKNKDIRLTTPACANLALDNGGAVAIILPSQK